MIVIEGPDGSGKTILVGQISRAFPQLRMTHDLTKDDKFEEKDRLASVRERTYTALAKAVGGQGPPFIYDRLYYSELVYGNLLREGTKFSDEECVYINRVIETINPVVVFCLPTYELVRNHVRDSEQMTGVKEYIGSIYNTYVAMHSKAPHIRRYNYLAESPDRILDVVGNYLKGREYRTW